MKRFLLLIMCALTITSYVNAQEIEPIGGATLSNVTSVNNATRKVAAAYSADNIFVGCNYDNNFNSAFNLKDPVGVSAFVAKYDKNMNLQASVSIVGSATITSMTEDGNGGVYVAGLLADEVEFYGSDNAQKTIAGMKMDGAFTTGQNASFIAHYDKDLKIVEVKSYIATPKDLSADKYFPADGDVYFKINKIEYSTTGKLFLSAKYSGVFKSGAADLASGTALLYDFMYIDLAAATVLTTGNDLSIANVAYQVASPSNLVDTQDQVFDINFTTNGNNFYVLAIANGMGDVKVLGLDNEVDSYSYDAVKPLEGGRNFIYLKTVSNEATTSLNKSLSQVTSDATFNSIDYFQYKEGKLYVGGVFMEQLAFDNAIKSVGETDIFLAAFDSTLFNAAEWCVADGKDEGDITKNVEKFKAAGIVRGQLMASGAVQNMSTAEVIENFAVAVALDGTGKIVSKENDGVVLITVDGENFILVLADATFTTYEISSFNQAGVESVIDTKDVVKLYPNPVVENLNFTKTCDVEIYSAQGQSVIKAEAVNSLNVSDLTSGMYLARIAVDGKSTVVKFVKR